jgi:hypothetical protein
MIKLILITVISTLVATSKESCSRQEFPCFKGRLEIKGICSNYTIKFLEGNIDKSLIEANWTDENTGKKYTHVFGLGSPCTFPEAINEGDEFYFTIDNSRVQNCNVCLAFYPIPAKKLSIAVCTQP